jgi:two-component system, NarL family, invasion response regulator UvrY
MIRIVIVDDQALVRAGLKEILSKDPEFQVVAEGGTGEDAVMLARKEKPDVMLLDVSMPGGLNGVEALERILRLPTAPKVLMVTQHEELALVKRLIDMGAAGYLSKGCEASELTAAIRKAKAGRRVVSQAVAQELALASENQISKDPFKALSPRELEVIMSQLQAERNNQISSRLHVSTKTISTYKRRAFEKLGIKNDTELLRLAVAHGLLPELYVQSQPATKS